jgi:hypothetical protein
MVAKVENILPLVVVTVLSIYFRLDQPGVSLFWPLFPHCTSAPSLLPFLANKFKALPAKIKPH